jgi:hypothetical protein
MGENKKIFSPNEATEQRLQQKYARLTVKELIDMAVELHMLKLKTDAAINLILKDEPLSNMLMVLANNNEVKYVNSLAHWQFTKESLKKVKELCKDASKEKEWYKVSFYANMNEEDIRAMNSCFFEAMRETMLIEPCSALNIEPDDQQE